MSQKPIISDHKILIDFILQPFIYFTTLASRASYTKKNICRVKKIILPLLLRYWRMIFSCIFVCFDVFFFVFFSCCCIYFVLLFFLLLYVSSEVVHFSMLSTIERGLKNKVYLLKSEGLRFEK